MMNNNYTVYMHTCPNNKKYIGITKQNPKYRWDKGRGYRGNDYFTRAIKKYGWDNIKHEILLTNLSKQEAEQNEIELIKKYKTNNRKYGYNIQNGGNVNCVSEETKKRISKTLKIKSKNNLKLFKKGHKPWTTGKKMTIEHRKKLSDSHKGKKLNVIQKEKVLKALKETNENKKKPIYQYDLNNNLIKEWKSAIDVEKVLKINHSHICQCCKNLRKTTGGFIWKYVD